jgi:hypothetical protein
MAEAISPPNSKGISVILGRSAAGEVGQVDTFVRWRVKVKSNGTLVVKEGPIDLGTLGDGENLGRGVNSKSLAVGKSNYDAFKKTKNGPMRALKKLKIEGVKAAAGIAWDVNEYKDIVGDQMHQWGPVSKANSGNRGVLWIGGKTLVDLNEAITLGRRDRIKRALAINDAGEIIVSISFKRSFTTQAGLLIPRY